MKTLDLTFTEVLEHACKKNPIRIHDADYIAAGEDNSFSHAMVLPEEIDKAFAMLRPEFTEDTLLKRKLYVNFKGLNYLAKVAEFEKEGSLNIRGKSVPIIRVSNIRWPWESKDQGYVLGVVESHNELFSEVEDAFFLKILNV